MDSLIIADDLSGAADCAAAARRASVVALNWPPIPQGGLVAVDLNSRKASAAHAAERAARAIGQLLLPETLVLYQKIDSLLRGNWATELAAINEALGARRAQKQLAILTPAWPERERTLVDGTVHLTGIPLHLKRLQGDDGASLDGNVAASLERAGLSTTLIRCDSLVRGLKEALLEALDRGVDVAICDAATRVHLDLIATSSVPMAERVYWVGSAGLMGSLSKTMGWVPEPTRLTTFSPAPVLVVVGSASATSHAQLEQLRQSGTCVITIDPADLTINTNPRRRRIITERIAAHVATKLHLAVAIKAIEAPDLRSGTGLLQELIQLLLPFVPEFGGLVLTGGETAREMLVSIGVSTLRLMGECEPGVPLGMTTGDVQIPVITKAGTFGGPNTLIHALAVLQGEASPIFPQSGAST